MTSLSDNEANRLFKQANDELRAFNIKRSAQEWPIAFPIKDQCKEQE